jgi:hypothetical protein
MRASLEATWKKREDAEKLEDPMLMQQAGNDSFVNTAGLRLQSRQILSEGRLPAVDACDPG